MNLTPFEAVSMFVIIALVLALSTRRDRGAWRTRASHGTQWKNDKRGETQSL